jgi:hypothetical protein
MNLIEFPLDGGGSVLVQVSDSSSDLPTTRGWGDKQIRATAGQTFEHAISAVQPAAEALLNRVKAIGSIDEVSIEFGLELSAEAGAFIASTAATANFKISMTWRQPGRPGS